ncbi:protein disulfide-isomerase, partial [Tremellales sp. Uapishka_1]
MRFLGFLAIISTCLAGISAAETTDDFPLRQLTEDTFRASTAQGLWLVEHFSPKCAHCRQFAPTWTKLARDKQHLERLAGFHMAQVNCLAQGDLCNSNGIKFYPQLVLYSNGTPLPAYTGDRVYDDLSAWIDEQSTLFAKGLNDPSSDGDEVVLVSKPNRDGKVALVDQIGLESFLSQGAAFVEFFAPWCGHCKKLAPIYDQLGEAMKDKLNVIKVDCDANTALCRKHGVQGYPTLRLFNHGAEKDYMGARTLEAMTKFAMESVDVELLKPIRMDDFAEIVLTEDVFFLYLRTFDTTLAELESVKTALEPLLNAVPSYMSSDPAFYSNLSVSNPPPTSLLLAFSSSSQRPIASLPFPTSPESITKFLNHHRFPTVVHLTSANYHELMKSPTRAIVVLGAIHKGEEGEKEKEIFRQVARAWKRGGREFVQPVWFAWVEGDKWQGWLRQSYGIKKKHLPGVVIIDTPLEEYYDTTLEGTKVSFDGTAIFSVLEGVYQHFLRPKKVETTFEWGSRSATMTLINLGQIAIDHPLWAIITLVGTVGVFVTLLQRCLIRDPREISGGGGNRLD